MPETNNFWRGEAELVKSAKKKDCCETVFLGILSFWVDPFVGESPFFFCFCFCFRFFPPFESGGSEEVLLKHNTFWENFFVFWDLFFLLLFFFGENTLEASVFWYFLFLFFFGMFERKVG